MSGDSITDHIRLALEHIRTVHFTFLVIGGTLAYVLLSNTFPREVHADLKSLDSLRGHISDLYLTRSRKLLDRIDTSDVFGPPEGRFISEGFRSRHWYIAATRELMTEREIVGITDSSWLSKDATVAQVRHGFELASLRVRVAVAEPRAGNIYDMSMTLRPGADLDSLDELVGPTPIAGLLRGHDTGNGSDGSLSIIKEPLKAGDDVGFVLLYHLDTALFRVNFPSWIGMWFEAEPYWSRLREMSIREALSVTDPNASSAPVSVFGISVERRDALTVLCSAGLLATLYLLAYSASLVSYVDVMLRRGHRIDPFPLPWLGALPRGFAPVAVSFSVLATVVFPGFVFGLDAKGDPLSLLVIFALVCLGVIVISYFDRLSRAISSITSPHNQRRTRTVETPVVPPNVDPHEPVD